MSARVSTQEAKRHSPKAATGQELRYAFHPSEAMFRGSERFINHPASDDAQLGQLRLMDPLHEWHSAGLLEKP